ncbi:hypothetical protein ACLOJK_031226 [Asimina triloba]
MLGEVLCIRPRTLIAAPVPYPLVNRLGPDRPVSPSAGENGRRSCCHHHSGACSGSGGGGAASIWHVIAPSGGGGAAAILRGARLARMREEGSWNAAWDVRPARWLHGPDSAWMLFGVCPCFELSHGCGNSSAGTEMKVEVEVMEEEEESQVMLVVDGETKDDGAGYRVTGSNLIGWLSKSRFHRFGMPFGAAGSVDWLSRVLLSKPGALASLFSFISMHRVQADGRCLFRAIVHGACLSSGKEAPDETRQRELADELRAQVVVAELLKRRVETELFIDGDFDAYVKSIQQPYTWAGEPELLMASHVLRAPISVFMINRSSGSLVNVASYGDEYGIDTNSPIKVLFHGYGHYDALERVDKLAGSIRARFWPAYETYTTRASNSGSLLKVKTLEPSFPRALNKPDKTLTRHFVQYLWRWSFGVCAFDFLGFCLVAVPFLRFASPLFLSFYDFVFRILRFPTFCPALMDVVFYVDWADGTEIHGVDFSSSPCFLDKTFAYSGVEVKAGEPVKCEPGEKIIHLSQASLGEAKKDKGNDSIPIFVKVDDKKLVLGTLSPEKCAQISFDLVFERDFELSHNWKHGSIYFCGYRSVIQDEYPLDFVLIFEDFTESDSEEDIPVQPRENGKAVVKDEQAKAAAKAEPAAAKPKVQIVEPSKGKEEDDSDDEDDEDDSSEDESNEDEEMVGAGDESDDEEDDDSSDEEEDEATPKKDEKGKKRAIESAIKTPVQDKKAKLSTPVGLKPGPGGKKGGGHTATPHPSKHAGKISADGDKSKQTPKSGSQVSCKSCNRVSLRTFNSENALQSHTKAKHSGGK